MSFILLSRGIRASAPATFSSTASYVHTITYFVSLVKCESCFACGLRTAWTAKKAREPAQCPEGEVPGCVGMNPDLRKRLVGEVRAGISAQQMEVNVD